jgi:uncharacterized membrane protein
MKRVGIAIAAAAALTILSPVQAAHAGNGVAVGLIGGLAAGTIIGAAVAQPRYYYAPAPVAVRAVPGCYWTRGPAVWNEYRGIWVHRRVQVCD